ncbi:uncharacterized protein KY384_004683 [Bacidia gigantensis]|uniref:uncharacterized protein n=1 Tax=Bacidia gigantensis TaxID=2732470 RepID=UPI001D040240|nr:uncharacterized protein KY384_004683 [Bacidia gigantensis]KAG8530645.1 hypothetical protein KY384_004683 [Bacidia gigantensis]
MAVGVADQVGWPQYFEMDGFLGLSWHYANQDKPVQATFSEAIRPKLQSKIFAIDFPSSVYPEGGKVDLTFGYINSTKAAAGLRTAYIDPVKPKWTATGAQFSISEDQVRVVDNSSKTWTQNMNFGAWPLDVGTEVIQAYHSRVTGSQVTSRKSNGEPKSYNFPCNSPLPDLNVYFQGGGAGTWYGRQLSNNDPDANGHSDDPTAGNVGYLFFQNNYVVFDMDETKPRIQFAPWNGTDDKVY